MKRTMLARVTAAGAAVLVAALSLSGCANTVSSVTTADNGSNAAAGSSSAAPSSSSPSPVNTAASPSAQLNGTTHVTDASGYTFDLNYSLQIGPTVNESIVNDKPGFATI